ncbi:MAG: methyltransferase domain-containing protein [Rhodanobacteraceae bacterium]|nr:methyltransferase domain-containing protein [Rhodanobacteraceae bacterium]
MPAGHRRQSDFRMHCGDVGEQLEQLDGSFDAMVGYFMLHHLPELGSYFRKAFTALKPGGRMVFVEPNPWCPLFPIQITLTPGMRWAAEQGNLWAHAKTIEHSRETGGLHRAQYRALRLAAPCAYNWLGKWNRERMLEPFVPRSMKPFNQS